MTTVAQLRAAIIRCAENALATEPTDRDLRARCFVARLSGSMQHLQEPELDKALWALLTPRPESAPNQAAGDDACAS